VTALRPVVAVALVDRAGRVLVQRRPAGRQHAGLWEFPGGKVEPGETLAAAAVREIDEELGVVLHAASLEPVSFAESGGAGGGIVLMLFMARAWRGVPECRDADALAWVAPGALADLAMPPLDIPLSAALVRRLETGPFGENEKSDI